jgi:hypothetical protein
LSEFIDLDKKYFIEYQGRSIYLPKGRLHVLLGMSFYGRENPPRVAYSPRWFRL